VWEKEQVGTIIVDSGAVVISDMAFIVPPEEDRYARRNESAEQTIGTPYGACFNGCSMAFATGGDGEYPVTVERNSDGRVVSVTITFLDKELDL